VCSFKRRLISLQSEGRELLANQRFHLLIVVLKDFQDSPSFIALSKQHIFQSFGRQFLLSSSMSIFLAWKTFAVSMSR
jgi:hypothetical protein